MKSTLGIILWISLVSLGGLAQELNSVKIESPKMESMTSTALEMPVLWGHNLTPTTYTLKKNQVTAGTYVLGYGVTDNFMICTSPWIDLLYNMPSIDGRYLIAEIKDFRFLLDVSYFKTFQYLRNVYQQNSTFVRAVASQRFSSFYTIHEAFDYQYFWDETVPYSLDPTPGFQYTTSVSTLHEIHWFKHIGTFLEAGVLGLNYNTPYLHLGASAFGTWKNWMFQIGVSRSSSMGMEYAITNNYGYWYLSRVLWHPEIQLQAYF